MNMQRSDKPKVLVVVGPTSSGKSALAVEIAKAFNGEVISADSRQVYRALNIGTGKVTRKEMQGVPHHLLDVADPKKRFSAADFARLGKRAIDDILSSGKLPIIAGGTGFYIDALLYPDSLPAVPPNYALRAKLERRSTQSLYSTLKTLDPKRAETIEPQNKRRLIRAIEIAEAVGKSPSPKRGSPYDLLVIGIFPPKEVLRGRIHDRLYQRMRRGMVAEARRLHTRGLSYTRMRELGLEYRILADFLQGQVTKAEMLARLETDIWHYAKRQMTWWRGRTLLRIERPSLPDVRVRIERFLKK